MNNNCVRLSTTLTPWAWQHSHRQLQPLIFQQKLSSLSLALDKRVLVSCADDDPRYRLMSCYLIAVLGPETIQGICLAAERQRL